MDLQLEISFQLAWSSIHTLWAVLLLDHGVIELPALHLSNLLQSLAQS